LSIASGVRLDKNDAVATAGAGLTVGIIIDG
jgi:hypothetical protein